MLGYSLYSPIGLACLSMQFISFRSFSRGLGLQVIATRGCQDSATSATGPEFCQGNPPWGAVPRVQHRPPENVHTLRGHPARYVTLSLEPAITYGDCYLETPFPSIDRSVASSDSPQLQWNGVASIPTGIPGQAKTYPLLLVRRLLLRFGLIPGPGLISRLGAVPPNQAVPRTQTALQVAQLPQAGVAGVFLLPVGLLSLGHSVFRPNPLPAGGGFSLPRGLGLYYLEARSHHLSVQVTSRSSPSRHL